MLNFSSPDSKGASGHAKVILKYVVLDEMTHFFWNVVPNKVEVEDAHVLSVFKDEVFIWEVV